MNNCILYHSSCIQLDDDFVSDLEEPDGHDAKQLKKNVIRRRHRAWPEGSGGSSADEDDDEDDEDDQ
ncbi:unnamed protein product, partial [Protopolystoma xenopodis]